MLKSIRLAIAVVSFTIGADLANGSTLITFDDLSPRSSDKILYPYHGLAFSGNPYDGIFNGTGSPIPGVRNGP